MTVLHIIASSTSWAGMEQYAFDLSRGLIARGHKVVFVIADDGDTVSSRFRKIGTVYQLPLSSKFRLRSIARLNKIIKKEKPDIIHTHQPKNIFQAHFARGANKNIDIVHTLHFVINPTPPDWLYSWIFNKTSKVIGVSQQVSRRALEVYPELNPDKVVTVINSIDKERFGQAIGSKEHSVQTIIGYAGRLVAEKGVDVLIHAAAILHKQNIPFKLCLAGTGNPDYVNRLKEIVKQEQIEDNVIFLGFIDDMDSFINKIDIGVVPSVWKEPCSLMLLEYMANGKAIISTNNGGQPEVIDSGENGILIDPSDAEALAESLKVLINDSKMRTRIGQAAKEKFETQLSFDKFVERTLDVYSQCKARV